MLLTVMFFVLQGVCLESNCPSTHLSSDQENICAWQSKGDMQGHFLCMLVWCFPKLCEGEFIMSI